MVYSKWKQYVDHQIELRAVELAGRGKRIMEPMYKDVNELTDDVFGSIKEEISTAPYALFGHSMGSLIAYSLAQRIRKERMPPPVHIFFSGGNAPHIKKPNEKKYHLLSDEAFKTEVVKLGGTPPGLFDHPELLHFFLPLLKNDFKIAETGLAGDEMAPLDCNITIFLGKEDELTAGHGEGWRTHTNQTCCIHEFEGGHFFLLDETEQIVRIINNSFNGKSASTVHEVQYPC